MVLLVDLFTIAFVELMYVCVFIYLLISVDLKARCLCDTFLGLVIGKKNL